MACRPHRGLRSRRDLPVRGRGPDRHEAYTPKPPRHTPDCLDWRRHGQRDITCTAHHGTDWFGPRAQVELENAFDGQIGFGK